MATCLRDNQPEHRFEVLAELGHKDLADQWAELFGVRPPKGMSRRLLIHAIAYERQARRARKQSRAARRRLLTIASGQSEMDQSQPEEAKHLASGSRLMREWQGSTYIVDVVDNGVVWEGRHYRSLSAVARAITGSRWNGRLFFGLTKRKDKPLPNPGAV